MCKIILSLVVITILGGCNGESGLSNMFGLFKKVRKSVVARELGVELQNHEGLPEIPVQRSAAYPAVEIKYIRGTPADPSWDDKFVEGESQVVYVVPASLSGVALAFVAGFETRNIFEVWEISKDSQPKFIKKRTVQADPKQSSWVLGFPQTVTTLPSKQILLAIKYHDPQPKTGLYHYDPTTNIFTKIDVIEPDADLTRLPFVNFEVLQSSPETMLIFYHTDAIYQGLNKKDVYGYEHVRFFSAKYPQGFEILKLGLDDGNIDAWGMKDKNLWLKTSDRRNKDPKAFIWSLNLEKLF
jgi:hypothetical protein